MTVVLELDIDHVKMTMLKLVQTALNGSKIFGRQWFIDVRASEIWMTNKNLSTQQCDCSVMSELERNNHKVITTLLIGPLLRQSSFNQNTPFLTLEQLDLFFLLFFLLRSQREQTGIKPLLFPFLLFIHFWSFPDHSQCVRSSFSPTFNLNKLFLGRWIRTDRFLVRYERPQNKLFVMKPKKWIG